MHQNTASKFTTSIGGSLNSDNQIQIECDSLINSTSPARLVFICSLDMVSLGAQRVARNLVNSSKWSIKSNEPIGEKLLGVENAI